MTQAQATAVVFLTAFKALPKRERWFVLTTFLKDHELCEDIVDIALMEKRRGEPTRSWTSYLKTRRKK